MEIHKDITILFDVDGTLTYPMKEIEPSMIDALEKIRGKGYNLSVVGGSDYNKIYKQLKSSIELFDYICSENGLVLHSRDKQNIFSMSIRDKIGELQFDILIKEITNKLEKISLPIKRDNFIEIRKACINVSPIGRSCSYEERRDFYEYDKIHKIRENLINDLSSILKENDLIAVIGGMISIDIYPIGWDKSYCLKFFENSEIIHFFGDKTEEGGNDYAIYNDKRVIGHSVLDPNDLINQLSLLEPNR